MRPRERDTVSLKEIETELDIHGQRFRERERHGWTKKREEKWIRAWARGYACFCATPHRN